MLHNLALALLWSLVAAGGFALAFLTAYIAKTTYRHYSKGDAFHSEPLPIHLALVVALAEVCIDKPFGLHRSRMNAVRLAEARREDAIEAALLRHPSTFRARQEAMARHPSAQSHTAVA